MGTGVLGSQIAFQTAYAGFTVTAYDIDEAAVAAGSARFDGIAEPEDIDRVWRIGTGAPNGPFEIFDVVGLTTAYNISKMGDEASQRFADYLKTNYIDQGKLGRSSGEGFYRYGA
nr:3-hydroxyacyl-CoA dehydrogenase family protein [Brevibacterium sp. 91QC2O2]